MGIICVHKRATCYRRGDVHCKLTKPFAEATDPDIVRFCARPTLATPLESAVTKNAPATPLECAFPKSLDLKLLRMNTYKKCGVSPLLTFETLRPGRREARRGRKGGKGDGGSKDRRELSSRNAAPCRACRARWCLPAEWGMNRLRSRIHSSVELASFYGKRACGRQSAQRGLGFPAEAGLTARKTAATRIAAASGDAGLLPQPK